jgi:hypothetical protein
MIYDRVTWEMALNKSAIGAIVAIALTGIVITFVTSGLLFASQSVQYNGNVSAVNVGVYSDSACTNNCTNINGGTMSPGMSYTNTIYIKNTGNKPVTLSMTTSGWNPSTADGPIALTWNRDDYNLAPGASVSATLTLSISSSISSSITSFSFKITITGAG